MCFNISITQCARDEGVENMRIYVSGILPEGCDLPIYVKVALTEYIEKGCGIVISARTDSELRERLRIFCNSFSNPRTDLICKTVDFPGLEECVTRNDIRKYGFNRAFFLWDRKDPLTLLELLRMRYIRSEVYLYDTDEIQKTNLGLIRYIVPPRKKGTVPFDQKFPVPQEIFDQLIYPERTKKFITKHTFNKRDMLTLIKYSDSDFADMMSMFKQLEKTEDILYDLIDYHYKNFYEENYDPEGVLSETVFKYLYPDNPELSDPPESLYWRGGYRSVEALSGLYESGSILSFSDGKPGHIVVIDGKINLFMSICKRAHEEKKYYSINIATEYELFRSRLSDKAEPPLDALIKYADPDFDGKFVSQKAISRIIKVFSASGRLVSLEEFKKTMELIDRFDQSLESPWEE